MKKALLFLLLLMSYSTYAADDVPDEIDYLLQTIGNSECTFIRNGERHEAQDAEDHLRMKYSKARRFAPSSEKFIERLASKSYLSKKPYFIECPGEEQVPSGDWLMQRLEEYRATSP
ncbi:MAG: DUF5329 domain-containing protein [Woeseiaceae bacterium]